MFGDITSNLGGAMVGGLGVPPLAISVMSVRCFSPRMARHPDIAGQGIANPSA
jgi:isocitrate/isopropylmalate dehydrogenase